MKRNKGMIILFLSPAVLMFSIIFLYPIVRTIIMSFFKIDGITDPVARWQFTGLANFTKLAQTSLFRISMWNLLRIWLIGGIIVMSLALLFAVIITSGIRFKSFFPGGDLSAEHRQRGGLSDHVAAIRLQPQVRPAEDRVLEPGPDCSI